MLAPRSVAAALGLLAFSVSILAGLWVRNPVPVILSRAIWAMVVFFLIGLVTGLAARTVVREHIVGRERSLFRSAETQDQNKPTSKERKSSTQGDPKPMGT